MIHTELHYRVLKAYGAGSDVVAIASSLGLHHGTVSSIVTDVVRFNRQYARTLAADFERTHRAGSPPVRRAVPKLAPVAVRTVLAPPCPPPGPPASEPEPAVGPESVVTWDGWLCELGRRYRDPGPHGAPKRCPCRLTPVTVTT